MSQPSAVVPPSAAHTICLEACAEAVHRITVVVRMLENHQCLEDDNEADATGGFDLTVMREALEATRSMLHKAARDAEHDE